MFGIPAAFIAGYLVARFFGDDLKDIASHVISKIGEWL